MREIKFRGKRIDNGEWVYGNLIYSSDAEETDGFTTLIIPLKDSNCFTDGIGDLGFECWDKVIPETVGMFTGLYDSRGTEICENDIARDCDTGTIKTVLWHKNCFILRDTKGFYQWTYYEDEHEVIGNIHDNPELLEVV